MNTNKLREVAAAATPGPWRKESDGWAELRNVRHMVQAKDRLVAYGQMTANDCAHIATFNPALVMKLLDVVEAAKAIDKYLPIDKIQTLLAIGDLHAAIKALEE